MKNTSEIRIMNLSKKRQEFVNKYDDSIVEAMQYPGFLDTIKIAEPKEIDELTVEIKDCILRWRNDLSLEFILEQLVKLGHTPSIISDGVKHFIVKESWDYINDEAWQKTVREALDYYLIQINKLK